MTVKNIIMNLIQIPNTNKKKSPLLIIHVVGNKMLQLLYNIYIYLNKNNNVTIIILCSH